MMACLDTHGDTQFLVADVSCRIRNKTMIQVGIFFAEKFQYILAVVVRGLLVDDDDLEVGIILLQDGREVFL